MKLYKLKLANNKSIFNIIYITRLILILEEYIKEL